MKTNLRIRREKSGLTQAQIAKAVHMPIRTYQRYETAQREPGVRTAIRIADVLDTADLRELFPLTPDAPDPTEE